MERFQLTSRFMLVVFLLFSLNSCKQEKAGIAPSKHSQSEEVFFIKDVNGKVFTELHPEILALIQKDLIAKNRQAAANTLFKTYDAVVGSLLPGITPPTNSGRVASAYTVLLDGHSRNKGWSYNIPLGGIIGYEGEHLRLEAFRINLNPLPPAGSFTIQYEAHCANLGWQGVRNPGDLAGTLYQSRAIQALRINASSSFATQVFYRAHVAGIGWQSYVGNNQIAGTVGQHRDLEAFQLQMVVY